MMQKFALVALLGAVSALRVAPGAIRMGAAVGDKLPSSVLSTCGVSGKKAVIFFYGADDAPSCSKEIGAFDANLAAFSGLGVSVVGVRNGAGDKGIDSDVKLVVDEGDAMRSELAIAPDLFGLLGGRETYVVDASGTVVGVHNNQFDPASHVTTALAAAETIPNLNPLEQFAASLGIELP